MAKRRSSRQRATSRRNLVKARQRRRNHLHTGLAVAGIAATVGAGAYMGYRATRNNKKKPVSGGHPIADLSMATRQLPVGHGKKNIVYTYRNLDGKRRKKKVKAHGERIWSVTPGGEILQTRRRADRTKNREIYDHNRRRAYWQGKQTHKGRTPKGIPKVGYVIPRIKPPKRKRNG